MAITYFGHNVNGTNPHDPSDYGTLFNDNSNIVYTCPGAGAQDVKELGARVWVNSTDDMRLAIYDTSLNFIMQGAAVIDTEPPAGDEWLSHTSFVDQGGSPIVSPQLTGGTAYIIAITAEAGKGVNIWDDTVTSGWMKRDNADYTGGFPATLTAFADRTRQFCVRCGVEPAVAAGTTITCVCADGVVLADTDTSLAALFAAADDSVAVAEVDTALRGVHGVAVDGIATSDVDTALMGLFASADDIIAVDDTATGLMALLASADDGVVLNDVAGGVLALLADAADIIDVDDSGTSTSILFAFAVDGIAANDTGDKIKGVFPQAADGVAVSDSASALMALLAQAVDGISASDAATYAEALASGLLTVTFSADKGTITFTVKKPSIDFTGDKPSIDFS